MIRVIYKTDILFAAVNEGNRDRRSSISVDKEIPYMNVTIKEIPKKDREFNNKEQKLINGVIALKNKIRSGKNTELSSYACRTFYFQIILNFILG